MADMSKVGKSNARRGKTLERRVAKLFCEWTGEEFRRRRVEGRDSNVIERESTADVIPVSKTTILSIEVKNAKGFSFDALMANPKITKFTEWWHQATYDSNLLSDHFGSKFYPFLFFKPIPAWDWVAFPIELIIESHFVPRSDDQELNDKRPLADIWFPALKFEGFSTCGPVTKNIIHSKKNQVPVSIELPSCYICRWSDLVSNVDPGCIWQN